MKRFLFLGALISTFFLGAKAQDWYQMHVDYDDYEWKFPVNMTHVSYFDFNSGQTVLQPHFTDDENVRRQLVTAQALDLLSATGYSFLLSDMKSICSAAQYDIERISKACEVLKQAKGVENPTGWLIAAINQAYEPSPVKSAGGRKRKESAPEAVYDEAARILYVRRETEDMDETRRVLVLTAGTSDIPVAKEAALTAELMGNAVDACFDVGVAGIHRLFAHEEEIRRANVIIVVAGMEGALASVVGGMTARPVIAVPTSVGYGASFHGLSALLAMLNSCAAGVAVMNIDNGYGAGVLASKINKMR